VFPYRFHDQYSFYRLDLHLKEFQLPLFLSDLLQIFIVVLDFFVALTYTRFLEGFSVPSIHKTGMVGLVRCARIHI
jgi:hypothetical protein